MGNIDDAVPFFGKGFNKIYPLIMVIYTSLIAGNFFNRIINYCGNWKIFKVNNEDAEDMDGFDPSGVIILQKGMLKSFHYQILCPILVANTFKYLLFCPQSVIFFSKDTMLVNLSSL